MAATTVGQAPGPGSEPGAPVSVGGGVTAGGVPAIPATSPLGGAEPSIGSSLDEGMVLGSVLGGVLGDVLGGGPLEIGASEPVGLDEVGQLRKKSMTIDEPSGGYSSSTATA